MDEILKRYKVTESNFILAKEMCERLMNDKRNLKEQIELLQAQLHEVHRKAVAGGGGGGDVGNGGSNGNSSNTEDNNTFASSTVIATEEGTNQYQLVNATDPTGTIPTGTTNPFNNSNQLEDTLQLRPILPNDQLQEESEEDSFQNQLKDISYNNSSSSLSPSKKYRAEDIVDIIHTFIRTSPTRIALYQAHEQNNLEPESDHRR